MDSVLVLNKDSLDVVEARRVKQGDGDPDQRSGFHC
jgi:hypothetical protein